MMTSNEDDDDYSPEDAYNLFTPIYRPDMAAPPPPPPPPAVFDDLDSEVLGLDFTLDQSPPSGVTLAGAGAQGGGPPPDLLRDAGQSIQLPRHAPTSCTSTRKPTALDRGRTDRISLTHDLDLDPQSRASYGHDLYMCKHVVQR